LSTPYCCLAPCCLVTRAPRLQTAWVMLNGVAQVRGCARALVETNECITVVHRWRVSAAVSP
jgi:hypothetical protein